MDHADTRPHTGWVSPDYEGDVHELDGADGSVWKLDREAMVWRRVAGPGATSWTRGSSTIHWTAESGWE